MNRVKEIFKKDYKWLVLLISVIIFVYILENLFSNEIVYFDMWVYNFLDDYISDSLTFLAKVVTNMSGIYFVPPLALVLFLVIRNRKIGFSIILNLVIVGGLNFILKNIVQRQRPNILRLIDQTDYSFPSGHAMVSMAFYGLIIYYTHKYVKNSYAKWPIYIVLSFMIGFIGLSRIYLGVHYASDVIAGYCISLAYLVLYTSIFDKFLEKRE